MSISPSPHRTWRRLFILSAVCAVLGLGLVAVAAVTSRPEVVVGTITEVGTLRPDDPSPDAVKVITLRFRELENGEVHTLQAVLKPRPGLHLPIAEVGSIAAVVYRPGVPGTGMLASERLYHLTLIGGAATLFLLASAGLSFVGGRRARRALAAEAGAV